MTTTTTTTTTITRSRVGLVLLAFLAFISLGLPHGLLGVAWPSIRAGFALPLDAMGLLLLATTGGYIISSFSSGQIVTRLGVGGTLTLACFAMGTAMLGYTLVPTWWMMVALGVLAGLGAGAIDGSLNTYVAANFSDGIMQWLHASFGFGVTLGPVIMTAALNQFDSWRAGYMTTAIIQIGLAVSFALTLSIWKQSKDNPSQAAAVKRDSGMMKYHTSLLDTLQQPGTWIGISLFFLFTGAQMTLGYWAYTLLTDARGVSTYAAGLWAGGYWGMFTLGRILAGLFAHRIGLHRLLRLSLLFSLGGAVLLWWNLFPFVSLLGVAVFGLAAAPIFPGFVSATIERVGARHTPNTIGIQVSAAALGGAMLAGLAGILAARFSLEVIPPYLVVLNTLLLVLYLLSRTRKIIA
jgi:fucose permease